VTTAIGSHRLATNSGHITRFFWHPSRKSGMGKSRIESTAAAQQRALVIGVGDYPAPISKLPAVANDVREMAKLLASKNGSFTKGGVTVLTDKNATRKNVMDELRSAFDGASADETVFVYLAGHR
jgi:metacaspase-1